MSNLPVQTQPVNPPDVSPADDESLPPLNRRMCDLGCDGHNWQIIPHDESITVDRLREVVGGGAEDLPIAEIAKLFDLDSRDDLPEVQIVEDATRGGVHLRIEATCAESAAMMTGLILQRLQTAGYTFQLCTYWPSTSDAEIAKTTREALDQAAAGAGA